MPVSPPVVFLDACVLYPWLARGIVLGAAEAGLLAPRWSPRVLAEWRITAAREGGTPAESWVDAVIARMETHFPDACVDPDPEVEATLDLPDPADIHVLAAAIAAGAEILLTFNLRDFPARRLAAHGVTPRHPDGFLWELHSHAPEAVGGAIRQAAAVIGAEEPAAIRRALKRAGLPRLARSWFARESGSG
ncbi:MAG: RSP_2648 family PIN domain-containing protein [Paracoccaceae bacterium]